MNSSCINQYILNYVVNDKTQNALMLTAPWGTGKSYYIKNELSKFLNDKNIKCIVVSLYGLKSLQDLSKAIFIEAKCKMLNKKSIILQSTKIIATTVAKGAASFFSITLDLSQKQLQKLYESLNFSNTLLILEDLERSNIDTKEIMGFVNNLVEHDGAKVLLVANEKELLKTKTKQTNGNDLKTIYDEKSEEYILIKEKTIGDTIYFNNIDINILKSIVSEFHSAMFDHIARIYGDIFSIIIDDIMESDEIKCYNLRAFKYACQKTIDLFGDQYKKYDDDFLFDVFLGNVAFCLKKSKRSNIYWHSEEDTSKTLGTAKHPLFKAGYLYIQNQFFSESFISSEFENYKRIKNNNYRNEKIKKILSVIYKYFESSEPELMSALKDIKIEIENNNLSVYEYLKLANYLISIKDNISSCVNIVDELKTSLINSLSKRNDLPESVMLLDGIELDSDKARGEYDKFSQMMNEHLSKNKIIFSFDYSVESLPKFEKYIQNHSVISEGTFITKLDLEKLVCFLKECNASQIASVRRIFNHVYNYSNVNEHLYLDYKPLLCFKEKLTEMLSKSTNRDKIADLQLKWFVGNLKKFLSLLKREAN